MWKTNKELTKHFDNEISILGTKMIDLTVSLFNYIKDQTEETIYFCLSHLFTIRELLIYSFFSSENKKIDESRLIKYEEISFQSREEITQYLDGYNNLYKIIELYSNGKVTKESLQTTINENQVYYIISQIKELSLIIDLFYYKTLNLKFMSENIKPIEYHHYKESLQFLSLFVKRLIELEKKTDEIRLKSNYNNED